MRCIEKPINVITAGSQKKTDIMLNENVSKESFYFTFKYFVESLEKKMLDKISNAKKIQSLYTIIYKEHKVTYLMCCDDKLVIMDLCKTSLEDYINSIIYR